MALPIFVPARILWESLVYLDSLGSAYEVYCMTREGVGVWVPTAEVAVRLFSGPVEEEDEAALMLAEKRPTETIPPEDIFE